MKIKINVLKAFVEQKAEEGKGEPKEPPMSAFADGSLVQHIPPLATLCFRESNAPRNPWHAGAGVVAEGRGRDQSDGDAWHVIAAQPSSPLSS